MSVLRTPAVALVVEVRRGEQAEPSAELVDRTSRDLFRIAVSWWCAHDRCSQGIVGTLSGVIRSSKPVTAFRIRPSAHQFAEGDSTTLM